MKGGLNAPPQRYNEIKKPSAYGVKKIYFRVMKLVPLVFSLSFSSYIQGVQKNVPCVNWNNSRNS